MIKGLLLGCAATLFIGSVAAQKPVNKHFNFQKEQKAVNFTAQSPMSISKEAPKAKGWFQNSEMKQQLTSANGVAKAPVVSSKNWFEYPYNEQGSCYVIGFAKLASALEITDTEFASNTKNQIAIAVPASYKGAVIDRIANLFYETENLTDAYVWVNDGLTTAPSEAAAATYYQAIPSDSIKGTSASGYLQNSFITLSKPVTVGENGCLIGISFNCPADARNIVTTAGEGEEGGFYIWYPFNGNKVWDDFSTYLGIGNLSLAAHMDLSNVEVNSLTAKGVYETNFLPTDTKYVPVQVTNDGYQAITSYSYVLTVDGEEQAEQTVNDTVKGGATTYVNLPVTLAEDGEHFVSVNFTKVNGKANGAETTTATGYLLVVNKAASRVSVVEEATSTACGYCPRGTVGMEKVKEEMGDKVVVLSAHANYSAKTPDPMYSESYYNFIYNYVSGFPAAFVNRAQEIDPYYGLGDNIVYDDVKTDSIVMIKYGVTDAVKTIDAVCPSEGTVSLTADWSDKRAISATASVNFNVDRETNPYSVLFVLSQDGMTGTDEKDANGNTTALWSQNNYYSQALIDAYMQYYKQDISTKFTDTDMDKYKNASSTVKGEVYNNVVVDAWGYVDKYDYTPLYGFFFEGEQIVAGEAQTISQTLDLTENTIITNWDKLKLAAIVINGNNGEIVNATQITMPEHSAGIHNVNTTNGNAKEVARYNVAGARTAAKGLNIVKYSDGTVKKVIVK